MEATASSRVQAPPTVMVAAEALVGDRRSTNARERRVVMANAITIKRLFCLMFVVIVTF
jgi:hypothetical protein